MEHITLGRESLLRLFSTLPLLLVLLLGWSPAANAHITHVGSASNEGVGTDVSVTHGISIEQDDVIVALVHVNRRQSIDDNNGNHVFFEEIDEHGMDTNSYAIYHRVATASEPASYQWRIANGDRWSVTVRVFRNVDVSAIWEVPPTVSTRRSGSGSLATAPAMNIETSGAMGLLFVVSDTSSQSFGSPTNGYADEMEASRQTQASYIRDWEINGTTGSTAVGLSSNDWLIQQFALRPYTGGVDTSAPYRSNGQPTDALPASTVATTISLTTNEDANCRYSTVSGMDYAAMPSFMSTTGGRSHSTPVTGLTSDSSRNYYIRCIDMLGNANGSDYAITVAVGESNVFQNTLAVSGLDFPVSMTFLPDGAMLVLEWPGSIRYVAPGASTPNSTPFMHISNVGIEGEQGTMDIALDPDYENNGYFYVYYIAGTPNRARVSRFSMQHGATTADINTEVVIWEDITTAGTGHHGGDINFDGSGHILLALGDNRIPSLSQSMSSYRGKVVRFATDGSFPSDNPFYEGNGEPRDGIWALGLRNPFRSSVDPVTGIYYLTDVGTYTAEEVNIGVAGANYGWPECEGNCNTAGMTNPMLNWRHSGGRDRSITGGFVYRGSMFPAEYHGNYFYADYAQNTIKRATLSADGRSVTGEYYFEPPDGTPEGPYGDVVKMVEGPDGALYYVDMGFADHAQPGEPEVSASGIRKIRFETSNQSPIVVASASPGSGAPPLPVNFSSEGSVDPEGVQLTYLWDFGDGTTSTEANPSYTYLETGVYPVKLTVSDGELEAFSNTINVMVGSPPVVKITSPVDGISFRAGDLITFSGEATDVEDGVMPAESFAWEILFRHDTHIHPELQRYGIAEEVLEIPSTGHEFGDETRFEFNLKVTDSDGTEGWDTVTIWPEKVDVTFDTVPSGLDLVVDGITLSTPSVKDTLIGFNHVLDADDQVLDGDTYRFESWSDGAARLHTYVVPETNDSVIATFTSAPLASEFLPADDALEVAISSNLQITFNEGMQAGIGNIVIRHSGDGSIFESIDVSGDQVAVNGNQVTINPLAKLAVNTGYYVEIDAGAITDLSGNAYDGLGGADSWNFTTQVEAPLNTAPRLSPIGDKLLQVGESLVVSISASDDESDPLSFSSDATGFMGFTDNGDGSATLTIQPGEADVGDTQVTVTVSDGGLVDEETFTVSVQAAPQSPFELLYSTLAQRQGGEALAGAVVSGDLFAYLMPEVGPGDVAIAEVRFFHDASNYSKTERFAPYDLASGGSYANPWSTESRPDGSHVIRTEVELVDGTLFEFDTNFIIANDDAPLVNVAPVLGSIGDQTISAGSSRTITVSASDANGDRLSFSSDAAGFIGFTDNGNGTATLTLNPQEADIGSHSLTVSVTEDTGELLSDSEVISIEVLPVVEHGFTLVYSLSSDRSGSDSLAGASISGNLYTRLLPEVGAGGVAIARVRYFHLASGYSKTESVAPYDLAGGGSNATAWNTESYADGSHVIRTEVELVDGTLVEFDTSFVIANAPQPPAGNVAPVLGAIGDQSLRVGDNLSLTVTASDANLDELSFSSNASGFIGVVDNGDNSASLTLIPGEGDVGEHSLTITVSDGELSDAETLTISVAPALGEHFQLVYSQSGDRSGSVALEQATISGDLFARLSPESGPGGLGITEVRYYLDGASTYFKRERAAPYDFQGGGSNANPWDTRSLSNGQHSVRTEVNFYDGSMMEFTTTFTVAN